MQKYGSEPESNRILPQDSDLIMSKMIAMYFYLAVWCTEMRLCVSVCASFNVYGVVQI